MPIPSLDGFGPEIVEHAIPLEECRRIG
jgi:hypothetical protein